MHLPTLAAFRETLDAPDGRFRTLGTPVCERDARDELRFATGGSAVVFRAAIDGRRLALKGYLHPRPQAAELYAALERHPSPLRCPTRYLPEEIYLYITDCGAWYDLLVTEWADGHTLDYEIRRALHYRDAGRLAVLAAAFEAMAAELLAQPWAHGDLKPSNIVVAPDNTLRLIDYDGAFVPEREGLRAVETGTPACNHPLRGDRYDKHIDDYPIALIAASLHALAAAPDPAATPPSSTPCGRPKAAATDTCLPCSTVSMRRPRPFPDWPNCLPSLPITAYHVYDPNRRRTPRRHPAALRPLRLHGRGDLAGRPADDPRRSRSQPDQPTAGRTAGTPAPLRPRARLPRPRPTGIFRRGGSQPAR